MPRNNHPLISVIIPSWNAADFLPEALDSIRAQGNAPLEIIVVDDGSTDHTARLVQDWSDVRYLCQENQGPSSARNGGIDAARGELLAFLDADDLWTPDHLDRLLPPLLADPLAQFVWGASRVLNRRIEPDGHFRWEVLHDSQPQFLIGSGLYRRTAFNAVGRFDPALRFAEDVDWIATARQLGVAHVQIPDLVLIYRKHEGGVTNGRTFRELNVMTALKRSIHRHRAQRPAAAANAPLQKLT
jgi:glycosyltransferase involved in cell wall biosynthesis